MQCYSCYDAAMYQYHGFNYKVVEEALKYIEKYEKLGRPVIECTSCGNRKKIAENKNGRWQEVFVPTIKE